MRSFALVVLSVISASALRAQSCVGLPSIERRAGSIEAFAAFPEGSTVFGAGINGSTRAGAFGGVQFAYQSLDDLDESATAIGVRGGFEIKPGKSSALRVCPLVSASYTFGPSADTDFGNASVDGQEFLIGGSIGGAIDLSEGVRLIPYAGLGINIQRIKVSLDGESESESETGGLASLGAGLELSGAFVVRPFVQIPFGFEASTDPIFGIGIAIPFGRRGK